jgi:hypothetical protein
MKNGDLEALIRKYPVTNIDWELNNVNVMNMSIRKAVFYYRSGKLLTKSLDHSFMTTLTQRMIDAETRYIGVYDHFVRQLKRDDYNIANILVDAWGRQFPKYDDVWGKNWGSFYKMNMQNNTIYDNGYELKDGNDIIVCKVTVSSIEGRAIYFLDVFE